MKILVTGASGLIGGRLVSSLEASADLWALSRSAPARERGGAKWIAADLASPEFVSRLPSSIDTVVHLAQSVHYHEFPERAMDVFAVNVASTTLLLDWSRRVGVRRFVLASAGGADRQASANSLGYYLASKRSGELLANSYRSHFAVTILRFFFVYGPGQRASMLVPRLVDSVRHGRPITLAGEDGLRINPVHVDDAVRAVMKATESNRHDVIDVAGPEVLTLRAIGDIIGARLGRAPHYVVEAARGPEELVGDITRMSERLCPPVRRFESGVDDVINSGPRDERSA